MADTPIIFPYIPETITVHLGAPDSPARNVTVPFVEYINLEQLTKILATITEIAGDSFRFARGLVNLFLLPFGRKILTGLIVWLVGKWAILMTIKTGAWVYHFIFK